MMRKSILTAALAMAMACPAAAQFDDGCIGRRDNALRTGLIVDVRPVAALTATLVVDEQRWSVLPFREKVALGETVECAIIRGSSPAGSDLIVRSHQTDRVIGTYKTGGTLEEP